MTERELVESVDLCDRRGRLNPAARGWSRQPLHRANLRGAHGRKKRWDYWLVAGDDVVLSLTYADVDYLGIASVWAYVPGTGAEHDVSRAVPFARDFALPTMPGTGTVVFDRSGLRVEVEERRDATRLRARGTDRGVPVEADLCVERPPGHETLNVVIPWSARRFQFTSKQNTRPVRGRVRVGDAHFELGDRSPAWATQDLGRGIWPYETRWNWASASGRNAAGRLVGIQFGGKWTEGTGYTENALCVDGRISKLGEELEWDYDWDDPLRPWRVRDRDGSRVDAVLTPTKDRHSRTSVGVLSMEVHQCFGTWEGMLVTDHGEEVGFSGLFGFAEEARNRW